MEKIRILVADDHRIVVEGLRRLLEPTYELVAIAENGRFEPFAATFFESIE